jgi:hypothetical protein
MRAQLLYQVVIFFVSLEYGGFYLKTESDGRIKNID